MRLIYTGIFLAVIMVALFTEAVWSAESVTGRVVSVDRDRTKMILCVTKKTQFSDNTCTEPVINVRIQDADMPRDLSKGQMVRVWLKPGTDRGSVTAFRIIQDCGTDKTGIHKRLRKAEELRISRPGSRKGAVAREKGLRSGCGH